MYLTCCIFCGASIMVESREEPHMCEFCKATPWHGEDLWKRYIDSLERGQNRCVRTE
jgi:hypothetical protein